MKKDEKIIQVSGFGVKNTGNTQCDYMLVALTNDGRIVMSFGDGKWEDVTGDAKTIMRRGAEL